MKKIIKSSLLNFITFCFRHRQGIPLVNFIFESGSYQVKDFFVRNLKGKNFLPPIDYIWKIRLLNGRFFKHRVKAGDSLSFYFSFLYLWHDQGLSAVENCFSKMNFDGKCYLDIGANMGLRSMIFFSEQIEVILFEPNKTIHAQLVENARINGIEKYTLFSGCVSDSNGEASFFLSESTYLSSLNAENPAREGVVEEVKVPVVKLDDFCAGKLKPRLIKVDVEGFELSVLRGARELIAAEKPAWILEIFPDDPNKESIYKFMSGFEYRCLAIHNRIKKPLEQINSLVSFTTNEQVNFLFIQEPELMELNKNII
jgi:FkbM family methyltransferase